MADLEGLKATFAPLRDVVLGVFLYGSHATGRATQRSDVDVCVVAGPGTDPLEALGLAWEATRADPRFDIHLFEELPLYLKGQVLDEGVLLVASDPVGLSAYLRHWRKLWADQQHRIRLSPEDEARQMAALRARRERAARGGRA